jgi:hypothetical protein
MPTHPSERGRKRPVRYWLFLVAVLLAPIFLGGLTFSCKTGDTTLVEFAIIVDGVDQIAFDPDMRSYDVWLPISTDSALVRAFPTDLGSLVYINVYGPSTSFGAMTAQVGGGEVTIALEPGLNTLRVYVKAPGGASDYYDVYVQVGCTTNADCDDGDPCTTDSCSTGSCINDPGGGCGPEFVFEQVYVDLAYGGNGRPGWAQAGDIDGDGDFDIVAGGGLALFVYENDGAARGWFRHGTFDSTGAIGANGAVLADVDEDGDLDVISAKYYDDIGWWENPCGTQCDLSTLPQWSFHKIGEVGVNGSAGPHYYLHDIARFPTSGNGIQIVAPAVSRGCGDVAMKWFEPGFDVYQEWSAHVIEPDRSTGSDGNCNYAGIDTGDVNGDGRLDIAFSNGWYEAPVNARQTWPSSSWHPITSYGEISNTLLRDLNGDGRLDFVTASGHLDGVGEVRWHANPAGASGVWPVSVIASLRSPECLQLEDMDGDGDLDVVSCDLRWDQWDQETHAVYVFKNLGGAISWSATNVAPNSYPSHLLQLFDLNGDGGLDIISEATGYSVVSYYENSN